jgi:hypothetical protein
MRVVLLRTLLGVLPLFIPLAKVEAQQASTFTRIGSIHEERTRLATLLMDQDSDFPLLRAAEVLSGSLPSRFGIHRLPLEFQLSYDSEIPLSLNEDGRWAGRGMGLVATAGLRARAGWLHLTLAPALEHAENLGFETPFPMSEGPASPLLPYWRRGRYSADLPLRYGTRPLTRVSAGASTLALRAGVVELGASTAPRWWGPGTRNALVLGNHAEGVPQFYLATPGPVRVRGGRLEAVVLSGALTESPQFTRDGSGDPRQLGGIAAAYHLRGGPSLGLARAVVRPGTFSLTAPGAILLVPAEPDTVGAERRASVEVTSVFGRWLFPADGLEVYGEFASHELPGSFRQLLTAPNHATGYTVGLQFARAVRDGAAFRILAEATNLEQSPTFRVVERPAFYTSSTVPQGYTHRGHSLGGAIGPGASSQTLGLDAMAPRWGAGLQFERIRWDNDAFYTTPNGDNYHAHDVSMIAGFRGHAVSRLGIVQASLRREHRYNLFFQNPRRDPGGADAINVLNWSFRLGVSTR